MSFSIEIDCITCWTVLKVPVAVDFFKLIK